MPLNTQVVTDLVQGVSQLPENLRIISQLKEQKNCYSSLSRGLIKRHPAEFQGKLEVKVLSGGNPEHFHNNPNGLSTHYHWINRDSDEQYVARISTDASSANSSQNGIAVWDLQGNSYPVVASSTNYLTGTNASDLRFQTLGDVTFIVNPETTVESKTITDTEAPAYDRPYAGRSFISWFKAFVPGNVDLYRNTIQIDAINPLAATLKLRNQIVTDWATTSQNGLVTDYQALALELFLQNSVNNDCTTNLETDILTGSGTDISSNAGPEERSEAHCFFRLSDANSSNRIISVDASDSRGDQSARALFRNVDSVSDLPTKCINGWVATVTAGEDDEDDFHVQFVADSNESSAPAIKDKLSPGKWVECAVDPATVETLDPATMPLVLVRRQDTSTGTVTGIPNQIYFTLGRVDSTTPGTSPLEPNGWFARRAGDDTTNPVPSIVGTKLRDIFFFKDRLGFLTSGNTAVFSEVSSYFNFWRTTVRDVVESDPVDVTIGQTTATLPSYAVPYQGSLVIFSPEEQYVVSGDPIFSSETVSVDAITRLQPSSKASPAVVGSRLFYPVLRGNHAGLSELIRLDEITWGDSNSSSAIPHYIKGEIREMATSGTGSMMCVRAGTSIAPTSEKAYVFKFAVSGSDVIQASWSQMDFEGQIAGMSFIDTDLYLVLSNGGGVSLCKIQFDDALQDSSISSGLGDWSARLDWKKYQALSTSGYDSTNDETPVSVDPCFGYLADATAIATRFTLLDKDGVEATLKGFKDWEVRIKGPYNSFLDGDTFFLTGVGGDPFTDRITFEIDTDGSTAGGNVAIDISGMTTDSAVYNAIKVAVEGAGSEFSCTVDADDQSILIKATRIADPSVPGYRFAQGTFEFSGSSVWDPIRLYQASLVGVYAEGNWNSKKVFTGMKYASEIEFHPPTLRTATQRGETRALGGHQKVARGRLGFDQSYKFKVEVTPADRGTTYEYLRAPDLQDIVTDEITLETGVFDFPVWSSVDKLSIKVSSDSPIPFGIMNAEWDSVFSTKTSLWRG